MIRLPLRNTQYPPPPPPSKAAAAHSLAFTRYCIASHFIVGVNHPFIAPPHLHSLPYCNAIARPLRNTGPSNDPPFVCHTSYNIGDGTIVQRATHSGSHQHGNTATNKRGVGPVDGPPQPISVSLYFTSRSYKLTTPRLIVVGGLS